MRRFSGFGRVILAVLAAAAAAAPAVAQGYTPYAQQRSLAVRAEAQVPPQTSEVFLDERREESADVGSFDRSLDAAAVAQPVQGPPPPYASADALARGAVTFAPTSISGRLATNFTLNEQGGWTGGSADATFSTDFLAHQGGTARFTGQGRIRGEGGYFVTFWDLDLEDPHGGPLGLFGVGTSGGVNEDRSYDFTATLQAGHRYQLNVRTETNWAILRNPPETRTGTVRGEFDFTLTVPEPGAFAGLAPLAAFLLVRTGRRVDRLR